MCKAGTVTEIALTHCSPYALEYSDLSSMGGLGAVGFAVSASGLVNEHCPLKSSKTEDPFRGDLNATALLLC